MKKVIFGCGALGMACGLWLAISGGANLGAAISGASAAFDYEAASITERKDWLSKYAEPMAAQFDRTLPKGNGPQPHMAVTGWGVDARRREIKVEVGVKGLYQIDREMLSNAKQALIDQVCPDYATSTLGQNKVQLNHSFVGQDGRESLSVLISPITCRKFM